jgi:hypothetical protein
LGTHSFTITVDHRLDDVELDRLYEAGCDDAVPEISGDRTFIHFDREAATLVDALTSAVVDVRRTGLNVVAVHSKDDLLS